jgi:hypothetical protein
MREEEKRKAMKPTETEGEESEKKTQGGKGRRTNGARKGRLNSNQHRCIGLPLSGVLPPFYLRISHKDD